MRVKFLIWMAALLLSVQGLFAQEEVRLFNEHDPHGLYPLLNLDYPGLERVKTAYLKGDYKRADKELLKYYRTRNSITMTDLDLENLTIKKNEQRQADESLEHKFYAHRGYESFFYGDDIDWRYWPVEDNELRWQLHRHYWFIPLGKAYYLTKDEKYAEALVEHYTDWVYKNPLVDIDSLRRSGAPQDLLQRERENFRFAWRPMEVSHRLQNQPMWFELIKRSAACTPEFTNLLLYNFHKHANRILHNYSEKGNHLLFEAQRMIYAGIFFPEFKDAATWRESGIEILNREIEVQVFDDGVQFELDYGYHMAAIEIFLKAYHMASANGFGEEFPASYVATVGSMTDFVWNLMYPDFSNPIFSDTKLHTASNFRNNFRKWAEVFPERKELWDWLISGGKRGVGPDHTSYRFPDGGYYVLRSGWDKNSSVCILKAGPEAFWHNQPDNGTFEFWVRGRNFFPDSGSYVYAGNAKVNAERDWFRQTRVHNTLTLDNRNLESTTSHCLLWDDTEGLVRVVVENQSYADLKHRRSMFLLDGEILVIADEATGEATGEVGIHFNLAAPEGTATPIQSIKFDRDGTLHTLFSDGNNLKMKSVCSLPRQIEMEEGWVSFAYREKVERPSFVVKSQKGEHPTVLFLTVIAPDSEKYKGSIAIVPRDTEFDSTLSFDIRVGGKTWQLGYDLSK